MIVRKKKLKHGETINTKTRGNNVRNNNSIKQLIYPKNIRCIYNNNITKGKT